MDGSLCIDLKIKPTLIKIKSTTLIKNSIINFIILTILIWLEFLYPKSNNKKKFVYCFESAKMHCEFSDVTNAFQMEIKVL